MCQCVCVFFGWIGEWSKTDIGYIDLLVEVLEVSKYIMYCFNLSVNELWTALMNWLTLE